MGETLDVVALDHQRTTGHLDLADARRAAGLVQMALIEQGIGLRQHRQHRRLFLATNGLQAKCARRTLNSVHSRPTLIRKSFRRQRGPCRSVSARLPGQACSPLLSR
jgi:hypothetical protein